MTVLIAEDDESVARFLEQALQEAGYTARVTGTGTDALKLTRAGGVDLLVLDVMLPGLDGFSVCRQLRAAGVATPILIITARDLLEDKIEGLDSGADDYLVKPFQLPELLARARALLRRRGAGVAPLQVADLTLDPITRKAERGGRIVALSATEYALLEYLMRHAGQILPRAQILQHVWQYDFGGSDNVLDVYVSYLRAKIDRGHPRPLIHTVRGVGFCLECHAAP